MAGQVSSLEVLREAGADLTTWDGNGMGPHDLAQMGGHGAAVEYLQQQGGGGATWTEKVLGLLFGAAGVAALAVVKRVKGQGKSARRRVATPRLVHP